MLSVISRLYQDMRAIALLLVGIMAGSILLFIPSVEANAAIGTNDYPSNLRTASIDSVVDPWGFYNRECTSFVAWRLNNDNQITFKNSMGSPAGSFGNANQWKARAVALGYRYDTTPAVGSVAWWDAGYHGADPTYGHVSYVTAVSTNGTITTEDYNAAGTGVWATHTYASGSASSPSGFIHFKDSASVGTGGGVQGMTFLGADQLGTDQRLRPGQYILSVDARFVLTLQNDGNLVLYGPGYQALWTSGTGGRSVDSLLIQSDGNVVLYGTGTQGAIWSTNTSAQGGVTLKVQEDGNVVLYKSGGVAIWSTGTSSGVTGGIYVGSNTILAGNWLRPNRYIRSTDGRYVAYMQNDGNLVLWSPGRRVLWASNSGGRTNVEGLLVQADGNGVIYAQGAIWSTNAVGSGSFEMKLQNDGNLVIYNTTSGAALWSSGTAGRI